MKSKYNQIIWSEDKIIYIRQNYLTIPIKQMAPILGVSSTAIRSKLKKMGLVIPSHILQQRKKLSWFKPGHSTHTKGKKWHEIRTPEAQKRCLQTAFKKGNKPHNTKPVGTINTRIDKNGNPYQWIKLSDRNWQHLHRYIWEKTNGPVPRGHVIRFKDGNQLNCKIENLECLTMKENMLSNSHINYPPELLKTIKLKNKINRKIKKYEQQSQHS
jgi:hypothetical protein